MPSSTSYAVFYRHHPTGEYVMVTVAATNLAESVFAGRQELRALIGTDYKPDLFSLARTFPVPR
jgi:hypothetical protein